MVRSLGLQGLLDTPRGFLTTREWVDGRPGMGAKVIPLIPSSVIVEKTADGPRLMSATDLQIVNGGQTTGSLMFTKRKDGSDLSAA